MCLRLFVYWIYIYSVVPETFSDEKTTFSLWNCLDTFVEGFFVDSVQFPSCLSILGQYHTLDFCSFKVLKSRGFNPTTLFFSFKIAFAILAHFYFYINFRINFLVSMKKPTAILIEIPLRSIWAELLSYLYWVFPAHEHGISLHSFKSSLMPLSNIFLFLVHDRYTFLLKLFLTSLFFLWLLWMELFA